MPGKVEEDLCDHSGSDGNFVDGLRAGGQAVFGGNRFLMLPVNTPATPEFTPKTSPAPGESAFQSKDYKCTRSADHFCGLFHHTIRILFYRSALFYSSEMKSVLSLKRFAYQGLSCINGTLSVWRKIVPLYVYRFNRSAWLAYEDVKFLTHRQTGTIEGSFFVSRPVISRIGGMWFNHFKEKLCTGGECLKARSNKIVGYCMNKPWICIFSLHRNSTGVNRNEGFMNEYDMQC